MAGIITDPHVSLPPPLLIVLGRMQWAVMISQGKGGGRSGLVNSTETSVVVAAK